MAKKTEMRGDKCKCCNVTNCGKPKNGAIGKVKPRGHIHCNHDQMGCVLSAGGFHLYGRKED